MITRTNHGAEIDLGITPRETIKYNVTGTQWTEPSDGLVHKIGLADDGADKSTIIATEIGGERRCLRLSPRAIRILTSLLIKKLDDDLGGVPS